MKKTFLKYSIPIILLTMLSMLLIYSTIGSVQVQGEFPKLLIPFLSTFFGAMFAFYLTGRKDNRKKDEDRISALRVALFTLAKQQDSLAQVWNALGDWHMRPDSAINMRPISLPDSSHLRQDLDALSFMIPRAPALLLELTVEDERFAQTIDAVIVHREFHVKELQPALEKSLLYRTTTSISAIESAMGKRTYWTASANAKQIFAHLIPTRKSLAEMMPRMFEFAKSVYPDEIFLKIEMPNIEVEETLPELVIDYSPPFSAKTIIPKFIIPN